MKIDCQKTTYIFIQKFNAVKTLDVRIYYANMLSIVVAIDKKRFVKTKHKTSRGAKVFAQSNFAHDNALVFVEASKRSFLFINNFKNHLIFEI